MPTYSEMVLVAKGSEIEENPDPIRLFITALARGTRFAASHPNQATQSVLAANDALDPKVTAAQMRVTLPLLGGNESPGGNGRPFGHQSTTEWQAFINWMVEQGVLANPTRAVDALTNELLPVSNLNIDEG